MSILFNVPRTAPSNDFMQKGPTCWYYAAKMLVATHNLRSVDAFDQQWKALHEVRKIISELSSDPDLGGDPSEDLTWLRLRLGATASQHFHLINDIEQTSEMPPGPLRDRELQRHINSLNQTLGIDFNKAKREYRAVIEAMQQMGAATGMVRFDLLNTFMPGTFVRHATAVADCTPESVEAKLREVGPFYASGDVWSKSRNRRARTGASAMIPVDTRVEVSTLEVGSAHAVVIAGVVGTKLYYKDPNNSSEVRFMDFDAFKTGWGRDGNCYHIELRCPHRDPVSVGGCVHAGGIVLPTH